MITKLLKTCDYSLLWISVWKDRIVYFQLLLDKNCTKSDCLKNSIYVALPFHRKLMFGGSIKKLYTVISQLHSVIKSTAYGKSEFTKRSGAVVSKLHTYQTIQNYF